MYASNTSPAARISDSCVNDVSSQVLVSEKQVLARDEILLDICLLTTADCVELY
jgi:hypothetical protein